MSFLCYTMKFHVTGFLASSSPESGDNDKNILKVSLGQKYKVRLVLNHCNSVPLLVFRSHPMQRSPLSPSHRPRTRRISSCPRLLKLSEATVEITMNLIRIPYPMIQTSRPSHSRNVSVFAPCIYTLFVAHFK